MRARRLLRRAARYAYPKVCNTDLEIALEHPRPGETPSSGIVFSFDRPLQLDALIRSHRAMDIGHSPIQILYKASTSDYQAAYRDLASEHESRLIQFVAESEFARLDEATRVLTQRSRSRTIFFLVDDIIFTDTVDVGAFSQFASRQIIPSLRLGRNIVWSYTHDRLQEQPNFTTVRLSDGSHSSLAGSPFMAWRWWLGDVDWCYPGSLDGNIFFAELLRELLMDLRFEGPNSFEVALNSRLKSNRRIWGICFCKSRLMNIPWNKVQTEVSNRHGRLHQDRLLDAWRDGYRIDVSRLAHECNSSVHEERHLPLSQLDV